MKLTSSMTGPVVPIDAGQRARVIAATHACIRQAAEFYRRDFSAPAISFDLTGRVAGMYRVRGRQREIRYNPYIFARYFEDNLANTVPHEVAHFVVSELHGRRRVRPHGDEWREVMHRLGAQPAVTCQYDLAGIPQRRQRRFTYRCACRAHALSTTRHYRVQRGAGQYLCRVCRQPLAFAGAEPLPG